MFSKKDGLLALIILTLTTALVRLIQTKKEQDLELDMAHDTILEMRERVQEQNFEIRGLQERIVMQGPPIIEGMTPARLPRRHGGLMF